MLQHERDQKARIERMVEQLARQHSNLEEAAQHALPSATPAGGHRPSRNFIYFTFFNVIGSVSAFTYNHIELYHFRLCLHCNVFKSDFMLTFYFCITWSFLVIQKEMLQFFNDIINKSILAWILITLSVKENRAGTSYTNFDISEKLSWC